MADFLAIYLPSKLGQETRKQFDISGTTQDEVMIAAESSGTKIPENFYLHSIRTRYGTIAGHLVWVRGEQGWDDDAFAAHINAASSKE